MKVFPLEPMDNRATMRIAFTSTWQKTELFAKIAHRLRDFGIDPCWIVTSNQYKRFLVDQGFGEDSILHLRKDSALRSKSFLDDLSTCLDIERQSGESVRNLIAMDRYVSSWPWAKSQKYAAYTTARLAEFLDRMEVTLVIGEPSVLHDLLAVMVCRATRREYVAPFGLRFPVQRFAFWSGYTETNLHVFGACTPSEVSEKSIRSAEKLVDEIVLERKRPGYFYLNSKAPRLTADFIWKLGRGVIRAAWHSKSDANMYTLKDIFYNHQLHLRPFRHAAARAKWSSLFSQPQSGDTFVLFTLHKQPEHTIDVEGCRFVNQYETVRALARALPTNIRLYVKEHPNCLGDRSPKSLQKIKALPGVRLIDPFVDSHDLVRKAECVVTISGTIAIEAALNGKRTLVLTDQHLAGFSTAKVISHPSDVAEELRADPPQHNRDFDIQYVAWILENSFEGLMGDPVSTPECMSDENVGLLANAIKQLTETVGNERRENIRTFVHKG